MACELLRILTVARKPRRPAIPQYLRVTCQDDITEEREREVHALA